MKSKARGMKTVIGIITLLGSCPFWRRCFHYSESCRAGTLDLADYDPDNAVPGCRHRDRRAAPAKRRALRNGVQPMALCGKSGETIKPARVDGEHAAVCCRRGDFPKNRRGAASVETL